MTIAEKFGQAQQDLANVYNVGFAKFRELVSGSNNLISVTASDLGNITAIKHGAFADCYRLLNVEIPSSVKTIGRRAFYACVNITNLVIPDAVTVIEDETFYFMTGLLDITLPSNLTSIGVGAFNQCVKLETITIPSTVTEIKNNAFVRCFKLKTLTVLADEPPTLGSSVFYDCNALEKISVKAESLEKYKSATNWSALADIIVGDA